MVNIFGAGGAITGEIVFSSVKFSSGVLERVCRAVVDRAYVVRTLTSKSRIQDGK